MASLAASYCVVGVISFKRPQELARLLQSLEKRAEEAPNCPIGYVVVVDNDPDRSARRAVADFAAVSRWEVRYVEEPNPGIAAARNRLIESAAGAEFVAMVDDDETIASGWPAELIRVAEETGADLVGGPVEPDLTAAPHADWMTRADMFGRQEQPDKALVSHVSTANCLIRASVQARLGTALFDSRLGLSGGSDWLLSERIRATGGKLAFAANARTIEVFPSERVSLGWISRRWRRSGATAVMVQRVADGGLPASQLFILTIRRGLLRFAVGAALVATALFRKPRRLRLWQGIRQIMLGIGTIQGLTGRTPVSYGHHGFETRD